MRPCVSLAITFCFTGVVGILVYAAFARWLG
jgi:hypothetical protein